MSCGVEERSREIRVGSEHNQQTATPFRQRVWRIPCRVPAVRGARPGPMRLTFEVTYVSAMAVMRVKQGGGIVCRVDRLERMIQKQVAELPHFLQGGVDACVFVQVTPEAVRSLVMQPLRVVTLPIGARTTTTNQLLP